MIKKGMKRIILCFLITLLLSTSSFVVLPVMNANAETSGKIGSCEWKINETVLTISGKGNMGYSYEIPWRDEIITSIIIEQGVTEICNNAFSFEGFNVKRVEIPNTVYSIGSGAFQGTNIQEIILPISTHTIGSYAFSGCSNLKHVWYKGEEINKRNMQIFNNNFSFLKATWHYNICNSTHYYSYSCDEVCDNCEWIREDTEHKYDNNCDKTCNVCEQSRIAPHNCEWVVDKIETCGENGLKHEECTICHETRNENTVIEATGNHNFEWVIDTEGTCGINGSKHEECSVCHTKQNENTVIFATNKHTYQWITDIAATCTQPGIVHAECSVCKQRLGETISLNPNGHSWYWVIDKSPTCGVKGKKHEKCDVCYETRNENTVVSTTGNHKYDNACDTSCNVCNNTRNIKHSYKTTTAIATLSKNGSIVNKCTVCGSVASSTTIKHAKIFKLSATSYTYNGKTKKPSVKVYDSAGKLISSSKYTVSYKNNKNVGKATVTINFKGNYSGTKTLSFTINPPKTSVKKIIAAKKNLKVLISKKTTQVNGYEIQYSTSKKFRSAKKVTIKKAKTTSATIKKLKAKKTYYVRVRTYKTENGKKYYSAWSKAKYKKTK